ncbi:MAG: choice-of-anchor Q domain-containing protein [Omnitrophica WOR_2 bacterium]
MSEKGSFYFIARLVKRIFVLLVVLTLILTWSVPGARAAVSTWYVRPTVFGAGDCTSWANACLLQPALGKANNGDQIWVTAGVYKPGPEDSARSVTFQLKEGVAVYGGFAGTETLFTQRDWAKNVVILNGDLKGDDIGFTNNSENSYHVVTGAPGAILSGVTISDGNANGLNDPDDRGGGVYNATSSLMLSYVVIDSNAANYGGGMSNNQGNPTLTNVLFKNNKAINGAGLYSYGVSNPSLTDVTFSANTASQNGGGVHISTSSATLVKVFFLNNTAANFGGGIFNEFSSSMILTYTTFTGNKAVDGGGVYSGNSNPTLTNATFNGNTASNNGGGMQNNNASPTLINIIFSGNTSTNKGGGVNNTSNSNPTLTNSNFSGNTANAGSGINSDNSSPRVRNSILWGDTGGEIANNNSTTTVSYSDVQGGYPGTGNINVDPLLAPLGNYGGDAGVQTMAVLPGSPVIGLATSNCPATDRRGAPRSLTQCDLGAFESQGFTLKKTSGDNQTTIINTNFRIPLCIGVTAKNATEPVDGGKVTFTAPPAGAASAILTSSLVTIASKAACTGARANNISGPYTVTASTSKAASVTFNLANGHFLKIYMPVTRK